MQKAILASLSVLVLGGLTYALFRPSDKVPGAPQAPIAQRTRSHIKVTLVDIIPVSMSFETNQDSEPNLAVNPTNVNQLAASAFTVNPAGVGNAPIFVTDDRGNTWTACPIVKSELMTADITLRFTRSRLYAGILRLPDDLRLNIQSTDDFLDCATPMTVRVDRNNVDQPYVQAADVSGSDRVYVGNNDFDPALGGRTATIDRTLTGPAGFSQVRIETRPTFGQDSPPIRPAIGPNNVVYLAFIANRSPGKSEVVVVRDDAGGEGPNAFQALRDTDNQPGIRVVTGANIPFENYFHPNFGQERLAASDLSIAVHSSDGSRVCIAWGDRQPGSQLTLHLRCSNDSGQTWSAARAHGAELRTVPNAHSPALAFNASGMLGFLWQQLVSNGANSRWETHFERFTSDYSSSDNIVLSSSPADTPVASFRPYLGDYEHVMAVGDAYYGIFAASNTPDLKNFPMGVRFQRHVDFERHVLLDGANREVAASIDPFMFILE